MSPPVSSTPPRTAPIAPPPSTPSTSSTTTASTPTRAAAASTDSFSLRSLVPDLSWIFGKPSAPPPAASVPSPAPAAGVTPPSPPPPSLRISDTRADAVKGLVADGKLDKAEAHRAIELAKADARLPSGETDRGKLSQALTNLYVRAGSDLPSAERAAGQTLDLDAGRSTTPVSLDTQRGANSLNKDTAPAARTRAEADVAGNAERLQPKTIEQIRQNPADFVRNISQVDGNTATTKDWGSCGTTSLMGGIILSDPAKAQDLAQKLDSPAGRREFPDLQKPEFKGAVTRMASGTFSPEDARTVSRGMMEDQTRHDGESKERGLNVGSNAVLLGRMQKIGFTPPSMSQETYGVPQNGAGSHVIAYANGAGYDSWPYQGNGGRGTVVDGRGATTQHGLETGPRIGLNDQKRELLHSVSPDGRGGLDVAWGVTPDGQVLNPPARAHYHFDGAHNRWERDSSTHVPADQRDRLPLFLPLDPSANKGQAYNSTLRP